MDGKVRFGLSQEVRANARVVAIAGEFDAAGAQEAGAMLMAASADPNRVLVIDLTECEFLDSTAIAVIVGAARPLINGQIKIAIAARDDSEVAHLLQLSGIDRTIPVLPTAELALQSALAIE
jgi:anti-anti-sigma factor